MPDIRKTPKARVELGEITTGPTDEFDLMMEEVEALDRPAPRDPSLPTSRDLGLSDFEIPEDVLGDLPDDRVLASDRRAKDLADQALRPARQNDASSFARGAAMGSTFGASDELAGGLSQAVPRQVRAGFGAMSAPAGASPEKRARYAQAAGDIGYRDVRDTARRQYQQSLEEDPGMTLGGEIAGTAVSGYLTRGLARGRSGALVGGVEGALEGFNRSEEESLLGQGRDALTGASIGASIGRVFDTMAGRTGARAGERPVRELMQDQGGAVNLKVLSRMRQGEFGPEVQRAADDYFWKQARANRETHSPVGTSSGALASPDEVMAAEDFLFEAMGRQGLDLTPDGADVIRSQRIGTVPEGQGAQGRLFDEDVGDFEPVQMRTRGGRTPRGQMTVSTKPKKRGARGAEGADIGSGAEGDIDVDLSDLQENVSTPVVYDAPTRVVDPGATRMAEYGEATNAAESLGDWELMLRTLDQAELRDQARRGREVEYGRTVIDRPALETAFDEGADAEAARQRAAQSGYAVGRFRRPDPEVGGQGAIESRVEPLSGADRAEIERMYAEAQAETMGPRNERTIPAQVDRTNEESRLAAEGLDSLIEAGREKARERTGRYTQQVSVVKNRLARIVNEGETPEAMFEQISGLNISLPEARAYLEQLDFEGSIDSRRLMRILSVIDADLSQAGTGLRSLGTNRGRTVLQGDIEARSPIARDIQETMDEMGIDESRAVGRLDQQLYPRPLNRAMTGRGPARQQEWQRELQRMYQEGMEGPRGRRTPRQEPQAQDRPPGSRGSRPRARANQQMIDERQQRYLDDYSRAMDSRRAKGLPTDAQSEIREADEVIETYLTDPEAVLENIENEMMLERGLDVGRAYTAARRRYADEIARYEEADDLLYVLEASPTATERQIARLDREVEERFYRAQRAGLIEDLLKTAHKRVGTGEARYFVGEEPATTEGLKRLGRQAAPVQTREPE